MIRIQVQENTGRVNTIEIPEDINLSMMEVLRAAEYPIAATCGGMALCATCHVEVLKGFDQLNDPTPAELDMLDTLPSTSSCSRLACQIRMSPQLQNITVQLKESGL
jgi:ferredoxin-2, mitochondrial